MALTSGITPLPAQPLNETPVTPAIARAPEVIANGTRFPATWIYGRGGIRIEEKKSHRLIAKLRGDTEAGGYGVVGKGVFSEDEEFFAYSVATGSSGREIRLFHVQPEGAASRIKLSGENDDLSSRARDLFG